jgi:hypothetical protein
MSLILEITTNEAHDFCVLYDGLSPLRKRIWDKISSLSRSWTDVKPSQSKLAEWCKCSRSAISEAFKIFKDYGWMDLLSRGWKRSKRILIHPTKRQIDVAGRCYFSQVRATHRATHTTTYQPKKSTSRVTSEIAIPQRVENMKISLDSKLKLSMVSEYIIQETIYQSQKKSKQGFKPNNAEKYFVETALKMAQKQGLKLDWRSYYFTKEKYERRV